MELFKLLFLYFLSLTGFLCYGNQYHYGATVQGNLENPNVYPSSKAMYYIVSGQQWNDLADKTKTDFFQTEPEQNKFLFHPHGLNRWDMVWHYIGSANETNADVISEQIKMLNEIYARENIGAAKDIFYQEEFDRTTAEILIANQNMEKFVQEDWDMASIRDMTSLKTNAFHSPVDVLGVEAGFNSIVPDYTQEILNIEAIMPFKFTMYNPKETTGSAVFIQGDHDVNTAINGKNIEGVIPNNFYHLVASEPIGGGGGIVAEVYQGSIDNNQNHVEFILVSEPIGGGGGIVAGEHQRSIGDNSQDYVRFIEDAENGNIRQWAEVFGWQVEGESPVVILSNSLGVK